MNNQEETSGRDERQDTLDRHKGRAKEMVRGAKGAPESRPSEPARGRQPEGERGPRGEQERGDSAPQGRPPAHAAANGLRRQQGGEEASPGDRRQQGVRERVDRIKQGRREGASESQRRGPQDRPGIAERVRMARSQRGQGERGRS